MGKTNKPKLLRNRPTANREKLNKIILGCFIALSIVILLFAVSLYWIGANYILLTVDGNSMKNTLLDGDVVLVEDDVAVQRGDIVIIDVRSYKSRDSFSEDYIIKRIICMEGDAVESRADGKIYVRYAGTTEFIPLHDEAYAIGELRHPIPYHVCEKNEIFFLGDNRTVSKDSSDPKVGSYHESDIVGVVPSWALSQKGLIKGLASILTLFGGR